MVSDWLKIPPLQNSSIRWNWTMSRIVPLFYENRSWKWAKLPEIIYFIVVIFFSAFYCENIWSLKLKQVLFSACKYFNRRPASVFLQSLACDLRPTKKRWKIFHYNLMFKSFYLLIWLRGLFLQSVKEKFLNGSCHGLYCCACCSVWICLLCIVCSVAFHSSTLLRMY